MIDVEIELLLMFYSSMFFTILFLLVREKGFQLFFGALTTVCWMILGVVFVASMPTFSPLGYLFVAIGLCFIPFDIWLAFHKPQETDVTEQDGAT